MTQIGFVARVEQPPAVTEVKTWARSFFLEDKSSMMGFWRPLGNRHSKPRLNDIEIVTK
jgi:hypothetical protein